MAHYLLTGSYTAAAWAAQIKDPQDRLEVVRPLFEAAGGSIESAFLAFGESDLVLIVEFPDNLTAASVSMILAAGGGVTNIRTTPLMTIEDGVEALKKAGSLSYTPPRS